jgi:hypothetical protein
VVVDYEPWLYTISRIYSVRGADVICEVRLGLLVLYDNGVSY